MSEDKIEKLEPPTLSLNVQHLLEIMDKFREELPKPSLLGRGSVGRIARDHAYYSHSPHNTAVGLQLQMQRSDEILMSRIKVYRQAFARPLPPICYRQMINGVIWLKRLRRKKSRRWNKKWEKRGLKIDTNKIWAAINENLKAHQEKVLSELFGRSWDYAKGEWL